MHPQRRLRPLGLIGSAVAAAMLAGSLIASPATANPQGTGVIINEAYLKAGSANAVFNKKFVELYNPTDAAVSLNGWSLQYRPATSTAAPVASGVAALSGTIAAKSHFLIAMPGNNTPPAGAELPTPDLSVSLNPSGTTGQLFLASTTAGVAAPAGNVAGTADVVDFLGYGAGVGFEGTGPAQVTGGNTEPNSLTRTGFVDTDSNAQDFAVATAVTPQGSGSVEPGPGPDPDPDPDPDPTTRTIAEVQGTGAASPLVGQSVTTAGVVTATYPTGGLNGYYIQTPATGASLSDATIANHTASEALFVSSAATAALVSIGDNVQVTGTVNENGSLTQLAVPSAAGLTVLPEAAEAPTPANVSVPAGEAQRESLEGMLLAPQGRMTVSSTYSTNQYAEVGLATGETPLITPTEIARPGTPEYDAAVADNAARGIVLDDGSSINFLTTGKDTPLPYLSAFDGSGNSSSPAVGAAVTFVTPVVLDYRNSSWKLQPRTQLTASNTAEALPATFTSVREPQPQDVGGQFKIASFNVLNYFTTTGDSISGCTYYTDRAGNPITVNSGCDARGAANAANLQRQQAKIVTAINLLGADVVSLEEIENSAKFGKNRDAALSTLTAALNTAAGSEVWSFVPSPAAAELPANEDVIRTAFIYKKSALKPVGSSKVLLDPAFTNARAPLAQEFAPVADDSVSFIAIANHFKSKGSGSGADADKGDGQGASNASRVAQAQALADFSASLQTELGTDKVFMLGDFNSYTREDPLVALEERGYTNVGSATGKYSYSFSGMSGSLDHVFASSAASDTVTGADTWNINSGESVAFEYSRHNYNATNLYNENQFRSSDHDPLVVGFNLTGGVPSEKVTLNLLNINDFHGRIEGTLSGDTLTASNTVRFAGTIEQLRAEPDGANTLLLSSGDNIGASLFASASQKDQPTIDVLNALGLSASAVGNHEFDGGFADLTDRVIGSTGTPNATFDYLGANVYNKNTTTPALKEYKIIEQGGLRIGVIGAITQETAALVSPGGISSLTFGDPVAAVNRVAAQLSDGDDTNGEADVIVAEYHDGAGAGTPEGADLAAEVAAGGTFARIVNETSPSVDAIFTGHTHKQYAWDAPVPGASGTTRPVLQTGSYGEFVGQVKLTVDTETKQVETYSARNIARTSASLSELTTTFPRVAQVADIVTAALKEAARIGDQKIGSVLGNITTAHTDGSYVDGKYAATKRDNRAAESALGNLVADSLVSSLSSEERGGATIGVVNPGGLRAELLYGADGNVTYASANAVLPFTNNLGSTSLTGAQFKTLLEQQWQTNADGTIPSRPFLKLGLSSNVSYTYDETRDPGNRITQIWVDGALVKATTKYRIGTFSFLLQGGDNFRAFLDGTNTTDSGLVDRDAWIAYLTERSPVAPSFAVRAAKLSGVPSTAVKRGETVKLKLGGLDMTSLGSPLNTSVSATWAGAPASETTTTKAVEGSTELALKVPASATSGELVLTVQPSGTVVRVHVPLAPEEKPVDPCLTKPTRTAFNDVPVGHKFFTEINWLQCKKLSTGWKMAGGAVYRPSESLTREAMAAFMFRLDGASSYQAPKVSPFADIKPGDKFYREISWMHEKGLSTGTRQTSGKPLFAPKAALSREAMAAFMFRLDGDAGHQAPKVSPFADVKPGDKFYREISWMYESRLSTGNKGPNGTKYYAPKQSLTREAMAAFMYRLETKLRTA